MIKLLKTKNYLVDNTTGRSYTIYKDNYGEGISMAEAMGVTSGQRLIYLNQLNMNCFTYCEDTTNELKGVK